MLLLLLERNTLRLLVLVLSDLVWSGLIRPGSGLVCLVWYRIVYSGLVLVWFCLVLPGLVSRTDR